MTITHDLALRAQRDQSLQQLRSCQLQLQDAELVVQRAEDAAKTLQDEHQAQTNKLLAESEAAKDAVKTQIQI